MTSVSFHPVTPALGTECLICTEPLKRKGRVIAHDIAPTQVHAFHERCIKRWVEEGSPTCPLCRVSIDVILALPRDFTSLSRSFILGALSSVFLSGLYLVSLVSIDVLNSQRKEIGFLVYTLTNLISSYAMIKQPLAWESYGKILLGVFLSQIPAKLIERIVYQKEIFSTELYLLCICSLFIPALIQVTYDDLIWDFDSLSKDLQNPNLSPECRAKLDTNNLNSYYYRKLILLFLTGFCPTAICILYQMLSRLINQETGTFIIVNIDTLKITIPVLLLSLLLCGIVTTVSSREISLRTTRPLC